MINVARALWPYAIAFAIGALAAYWIQGLRWDAEVSQIRTDHAEAIAGAESKARATEARMQASIDNIQAQANEQEQQLQADIATASASADSLRAKLAERTRRATADTGTATGCDSARATLRVYSELLDRSDSRDAVVSEFADRSRIAGLNCQAAYEQIRSVK